MPLRTKTSDASLGILPYYVTPIRDHYLLSTPWGGWVVLDQQEFRKVHALDFGKDAKLVHRLKKNNILLDDTNLDKIVREYRQLHSNLFFDTGLHIVVVTERCNFDCLYCQTRKDKLAGDMDMNVALKVVDFMFSSRNPMVRLEFQGGEPLLNWPVLKFMIAYSRKQNKLEKKNLMISLVTNMSLLDQAKINFLIHHNVEICTSFDGPETVHDKNRIFKGGSPTYQVVTNRIQMLHREYKKRKIHKKVGALPTVTRFSIGHPVEIIDEYVRQGLDTIHLRSINRLGLADKNWEAIGYSPEEFNEFWKASLDYILELNAQGIAIKETMTTHLLKKILKKQDPFYVDLESPCGAGRSQLAYAPNGDVYTCDEARMISSDVFKLGNVLKDKFQDVMKSQNLFYAAQASLLNFSDYNSAFCAWSGTCPVLNYHQQGNPVVKITESPKHIIHRFQFNTIFEKLIYDKKAYKIFQKWVDEEEEAKS